MSFRMCCFLFSILASSGALYASIPSDFVEFSQMQKVDVKVVVAGIDLGYQQMTIKDQSLQINLSDIFTPIKLSDTAQNIIQKIWENGIPFDSTIYCLPEYQALGVCSANEILASSMFTDSNFQLTIDIAPQAIAYQNHRDQTYIHLGDKTQYGSIFNYNLYFNASNNNASNYTLDLNNVSSVNNTALYSGIYASGNENSSLLNLETLYLTHEFADASFTAGYTGMLSNITGLNYIATVEGLIMQLSSSNNMKRNKNSNSQEPIFIYAQSNTRVEVYKDARMISSQYFAAGTHELDTSDFPYGIYQVELRIYQGSTLIETRKTAVVKPTTSLDFGDRSSHYNIWFGLAAPHSYRENGFLPQNFDDLYLGTSYSHLLTTTAVASYAAYLVDNIATAELSIDYTWSDDTSFNMSAAFDNQRGYGYNFNANTAISNNLYTTLWYRKEDSGLGDIFSAFSNDYHSVGVSGSLSLGDWYMGSLSLSLLYDLNAYQFDSNLSHYMTWYSDRNLRIYSSLNYSYSPSASSITNNFSVMLNFSYSFDDGSNINSSLGHQSQNGVNSASLGYSPNINAPYIDDIALDIDQGEDSNSQGVSIDLGSEVIDGYIDISRQTTGTDTTHSAYGSLSGSFVVTDFIPTFYRNAYNDAGVVIDMSMPYDATIEAEINDKRHTLHSGQNLIMLPAYSEYKMRLLEARNDHANLQYSQTPQSFTLLPGNIVQINEKATSTIQIIGQALVEGQPKKNVVVKNHVNQTLTDEEGYFMVYIDKLNPSIQINGSCKHEFTDVENIEKGQWIGVIKC